MGGKNTSYVNEPQSLNTGINYETWTYAANVLSVFPDKAGVTGLADRIERRGLAERITVPGDRRALRVLLTAVGQRVAVAVRDQVWPNSMR
jgi:hypothetical protein